MLVRLDLGDHPDRCLLRRFLGEVVAEQGAVAVPLPANVEIERQALLDLPCGDGVAHAAYLYLGFR